MTPLDLLDELARCLEDILRDSTDQTGKPFRVFRQNLPRRKRKENPRRPVLLEAENKTSESQFPYCLVELGEGYQDHDGSSQEILLVLAAQDQSEDLQGFRDVANAMERIRQNLIETPYIGMCSLKMPISWTGAQDDTAHPVYVGVMHLEFWISNYNPDENI